MSFDSYVTSPVEIDEKFFDSAGKITLIATGDRDDEKWSISISGYDYQSYANGTLRIDPSVERSQVIAIIQQWVSTFGFTLVFFEDKGPWYVDSQGEASVFVEFHLQRA